MISRDCILKKSRGLGEVWDIREYQGYKEMKGIVRDSNCQIYQE